MRPTTARNGCQMCYQMYALYHRYPRRTAIEGDQICRADNNDQVNLSIHQATAATWSTLSMNTTLTQALKNVSDGRRTGTSGSAKCREPQNSRSNIMVYYNEDFVTKYWCHTSNFDQLKNLESSRAIEIDRWDIMFALAVRPADQTVAMNRMDHSVQCEEKLISKNCLQQSKGSMKTRDNQTLRPNHGFRPEK